MTSQEFRANPALVTRLNELLNDPVMAEAIVCLEEEKPDFDAPIDSPEIVSVRILSQRAGYSLFRKNLFTLSLHLEPEKDLGEPTYEPDPNEPQSPS